jgi:transcriptional regulator with XRE-family HTH domain
MKKEVGKIVTACRQYHGFTQAYMAHKLGITVNSYANIEHGRVDMHMERLYELAAILRLRPYQILAMAERVHVTKKHGWVPSAIKGTLMENSRYRENYG